MAESQMSTRSASWGHEVKFWCEDASEEFHETIDQIGLRHFRLHQEKSLQLSR